MAGEQMVLRAIDHVGIAVPDLDAALTWYRETLGMTVEYVETNTEQGVTEAMVRVSDDDTGARLQILAPSSPDSPIARFLDRSGPGMQQLAYRVDDVEHAANVRRERGQRRHVETHRLRNEETTLDVVS